MDKLFAYLVKKKLYYVAEALLKKDQKWVEVESDVVLVIPLSTKKLILLRRWEKRMRELFISFRKQTDEEKQEDLKYIQETYG